MTTRITFRPIVAGEPAWQRQLRDSYADVPPPPITEARLKDYRVRPTSRAVAEQVILRYEWLGTLPVASHYFGIFAPGSDGLEYVAGVTAVACGGGAPGPSWKPYGITSREHSTLVRGACVHWAPPGANSKLVSWTTKLLHRISPATRLIVAYADSDAGEIGTIYQACGWSYIGRSTSTLDEYVSPSNRIISMRDVTGRVMPSRGRNRLKRGVAALTEAGWKRQKRNPKGRYALVLDKGDRELLACIDRMALPYPKRG